MGRSSLGVLRIAIPAPWIAFLCLVVAVSINGSCGSETNESLAGCKPQCEGQCGEPDGCGGVCSDNACVNGNDCRQTCESLGRVCGDLCGQSCGECLDGFSCVGGQCECDPQCDGTRCDDGCGGVCPCSSGSMCNNAGECVAPEACDDTCERFVRECGEVCGETCGTCPASQSCLDGVCIEARSCEDCSVQLSLIDTEIGETVIQRVKLAIHYIPTEGEPLARLADIRIRSSDDVTPIEAASGPALVNAGKSLYVDAETEKPFRVLDDGSTQLLVYSNSNMTALETGLIATVSYSLDSMGPVSFELVRRPQVLAPGNADDALQSTQYDRKVVVSR